MVQGKMIVKETSWLHWLKLALSGDPGRPSIICPFIDDGWVYCTDGHRVHRMKTDAKDGILTEDFGMYRDQLLGQRVIRLPKMSGIFAEFKDGSWQKRSIDTLIPVMVKSTVSLDEDEEEWIRRRDLYQIGRKCYSFNYVLEAFAGSETMNRYVCKSEKLYLRSIDKSREAVIMPIMR